MGNYFVMSSRLNKRKASDFGLVSKETNTAIHPIDNSIWSKAALYDFGWGKENGFYKTPLPNFDALLELALNSKNRDDMYGAAAMILEKYPDELLSHCESIIHDCSRKKEFEKLVVLFRLKSATNRCSVVQKTYEQVQSDYCRWKKISDIANTI